jgi:hypothetical protein
MARPRKDGIEYFSLDTDFFSDKKVKILKARYGTDGVTMYIYLLCEIYKNGYYLKIDEDYDYLMSEELNMSVDKVMQIRTFLLERSMFDKQLFQSDAVLTSTGIQKRYQEAVRGRASKTPIEVDEFWLLKKSETQSFIKVNSFLDNSENNPSFSENNQSFSEEKCTKESKAKENKINNKVKECVGEHTDKNAHTPLKQEDYIALCNKYGQYLVDVYIERTQSYKCCNVYTIEKWIIEDLKNEQNKKAHFKEMKVKKNNFSNFPQREYSKEELSELERKLLEKSLK